MYSNKLEYLQLSLTFTIVYIFWAKLLPWKARVFATFNKV